MANFKFVSLQSIQWVSQVARKSCLTWRKWSTFFIFYFLATKKVNYRKEPIWNDWWLKYIKWTFMKMQRITKLNFVFRKSTNWNMVLNDFLLTIFLRLCFSYVGCFLEKTSSSNNLGINSVYKQVHFGLDFVARTLQLFHFNFNLSRFHSSSVPVLTFESW